jgi:hypothetical protein
VISLNSLRDITISNPNNTAVYIVDLFAETPTQTTLFPLNFEVGGHALQSHKVQDVALPPEVQSIEMLGKTFGDHLHLAQKAFGANCLVAALLSESTAELKQMQDFYKSEGKDPGTFAVNGRLDYVPVGKTNTIQQKIPLVLAVMHAANCKKVDIP